MRLVAPGPLVAKAIPGLSVPYQQATKTYKLMAHGVRVTWDALEVRKALLRIPRGAALRQDGLHA